MKSVMFQEPVYLAFLDRPDKLTNYTLQVQGPGAQVLGATSGSDQQTGCTWPILLGNLQEF
jgi:hypothetical protein